MHQAWKHHAILIHQSCQHRDKHPKPSKYTTWPPSKCSETEKYPTNEKNIGILTQTCPPNAPSMETPCHSDSPKLPQMPEPWKHHGNLTPSCPPGLSQMLHKLKTKWKSDSWKLSHMLHKLKTQCNSSTGTNIPSPPDKAHGLQANAQRQRNITLMEKNIGILTQTCPPNAPSMETPCHSDSPKLPAQGQTSQAIQIHHMASKQMLRDRETWRKPLEFWLKPAHPVHQAWKHHAILIHQSCQHRDKHPKPSKYTTWPPSKCSETEKYPTNEKNIGILTQTCPPNAPSMETACHSDSPKLPQMPEPWKHHGNLAPSCPPGLSQMLHKLKTKWKSDSWKLSHMLHKLKTQCNSITGTNIPSPPDKAHGLQANAQRQRNITLMEKNIGILIQTCPPNAPSMETPCHSDSPKLPAQGQTSQAIQIHHMASKQMLRDREISH